MKIINYHPGLKSFFKVLNVEWLEEYFSVTEEDDKMLSDPERIIANGGAVFFVEDNNGIIGTCAIIPESESVFELAKMGVSKIARGKGAGELLVRTAIDEAKKRGAEILSLETATVLEPAIQLYNKMGFQRVGEEHVHPKFGRKTFRMEKRLNIG